MTPYFVVWVQGTFDDMPYLGLSASKKNFKLATQRNRAKRRLKEAFRMVILNQDPVFENYILIARQGVIEADFERLQKDMKWALKRLKEKS